jgi:hypothetical protein
VIFVVVIVLLLGLAAAVVVGVAKDPGPSPVDIALGFEHAWDEHDFEVVYRLSGAEMHDGMTKADWIAAKRAAYAKGADLGHLVAETVAEDEARREDVAAVMTRLTLRDGSVVHNEVRLLRRSRKWEVVAYELRPAPTP